MPGMPFVGVIARMDPVKGHETVLEAARILKPQVPGLKILCAGEGPQRERLSWRLKPQGIDDVVHFLGRVADRWTFLAGEMHDAVEALRLEAPAQPLELRSFARDKSRLLGNEQIKIDFTESGRFMNQA